MMFRLKQLQPKHAFLSRFQELQFDVSVNWNVRFAIRTDREGVLTEEYGRRLYSLDLRAASKDEILRWTQDLDRPFFTYSHERR